MCEFCKLKEISNRVVYKDDLVFVMLTNIPIVPGHILVCPFRHVEKIDQLTSDEFTQIFGIIIRLKPVLKKVFESEGFNFAWNESACAGQNVDHLHIHMLPRKPHDSGITQYEPRKFLYRPGSRQVSEESELESVADDIKKVLNI